MGLDWPAGLRGGGRAVLAARVVAMSVSRRVAASLAAAAAAAALAAVAWRRRRRAAKKPPEQLRVCVLGAGPAGLATLSAFRKLEKAGTRIPQLVCYEKQSDWGGMWNFSWRTGVDEKGHAVHSSMYKYLWSNAPKECLELADYSFDEHFGRPIGSYPPRPVLRDYFDGRATKADVRQLIQFDTNVDGVEWDEATQTFAVTTTSTTLGSAANPRAEMRTQTRVEHFDYVVCASGHYSTPNSPHFDGLEDFHGRVMHAHDLKDATEFKGQHVLIIGTSYSAEDIASQVWKYGAASVAISHRTKPIGWTSWPENIVEVPLLHKVRCHIGAGCAQQQRGGTATFADGSTRHVDAIILCTGYVHHFPFLGAGLRLNPHADPLQPANKIWLRRLYRGVFWIDNPRLLHVGPHTGFFTFSLFDAQAWLARDAIMGAYVVPPEAEMRAHDEMMTQRCRDLLKDDGHGNYDHRCIGFQADYLAELLTLTDHPPLDVEGVANPNPNPNPNSGPSPTPNPGPTPTPSPNLNPKVKALFVAWEEHKAEDIMSFRNHPHTSVVTGTRAATLVQADGTTPLHWKDAMDDTCESFGLADLFAGNVRR